MTDQQVIQDIYSSRLQHLTNIDIDIDIESKNENIKRQNDRINKYVKDDGTIDIDAI